MKELEKNELQQLDGGDMVDVVAGAGIGFMSGGLAGAVIGAAFAAICSDW